MKTVLVADVPQMDERYSAALAGCQIAFVRTMAEARQALAAAPYDLVAIGAYFDDSRLFDLVSAVRGCERNGAAPIACVRARRELAAISGRTLETTLKAMAADQFVDLLPFADEDAGVTALRAALTSCAAPTSGGRP